MSKVADNWHPKWYSMLYEQEGRKMDNLDLRDEIENHCNKCSKLDSDFCNVCFFASVDFGKENLGSNYIWNRAYRYLKHIKLLGFRRDDSFGTRLEIGKVAVG